MNKALNELVLVDEQDNELGSMEKLEAHQKGLLHRAFSILLFNSKGEMLIQKRASGKYHSGNLWSNACCSHPYPSEPIINAAQRRLKEEIGIEADCIPAFHFIYQVSFENNLIEHELDHVVLCFTDLPGKINTEEVSQLKYVSIENLRMDMALHPSKYTEWFKIIMLRHFYKLHDLIETNLERA